MDKLKQEPEKNDASRNKIKTPKSSGRSKSVKSPAVKVQNKSTKKINTVAYKRALTSARAIQRSEKVNSDKAEKFLSDISPYLNKKGELKGNLSNKKRSEFNQLVSQYKGENATPTVKKLIAREKKQREGLVKKGTLSDENDVKTQKEHQRDVINMFKLKTIQKALKSGLISSDQVVDSMKTYKKVSGTAIVRAAREAKAEYKRTLPKEARAAKLKPDDYNTLLDDILNQNLEQYTEEDIPF